MRGPSGEGDVGWRRPPVTDAHEAAVTGDAAAGGAPDQAPVSRRDAPRDEVPGGEVAPGSRGALLGRLYDGIEVLRERTGGARVLSRCTSRDGWPEHGIYLLFEPGELRGDGVTPRVTAVGSHGLEEGSPVLLWTRLAQHRGAVAGPKPGAGNHRRSPLRRHLGRALIASDERFAAAAGSWGEGRTATRAMRDAEVELEREVSRRIGAMTVLWLAVPDRRERASLVAGLIGTLSERGVPALDPPSPGWLGHHAPEPAVHTSGLWHVTHTDHGVDESAVAGFLHRLGAA